MALTGGHKRMCNRSRSVSGSSWGALACVFQSSIVARSKKISPDKGSHTHVGRKLSISHK
jgi:hypothetical protein